MGFALGSGCLTALAGKSESGDRAACGECIVLFVGGLLDRWQLALELLVEPSGSVGQRNLRIHLFWGLQLYRFALLFGEVLLMVELVSLLNEGDGVYIDLLAAQVEGTAWLGSNGLAVVVATYCGLRSGLVGGEELLGRVAVDLIKLRRRLALGSLEGLLVILRRRESLRDLPHASGHSDRLHEVLLVWHHGLNLV